MRHILIVDDNLANRLLLDYWLQRKGYRTAQAEDGRVALQRLDAAAEPFDLVLMDYHMPEMNGMEATRALRAREHGANRARLPVVAVTASEGLIPHDEFYAAGMDAILAKPICFPTLEKVLLRLLPA